ncbi:Uncharacterised protein [Mycobacterium tuberculosis]|nr:Uncharacterised protein [Mycobacterium tuberculosis]
MPQPSHPATRVLAMLELLRAHHRIGGAEPARRLGVDERTVRRRVPAFVAALGDAAGEGGGVVMTMRAERLDGAARMLATVRRRARCGSGGAGQAARASHSWRSIA